MNATTTTSVVSVNVVSFTYLTDTDIFLLITPIHYHHRYRLFGSERDASRASRSGSEKAENKR